MRNENVLLWSERAQGYNRGAANSLRGLLIVTLLWLLSTPVLAELSTRLDRERIAEGETVQLVISVSDGSDGNPDTTPLEKDFDVLGTSNSSQVSIINGRMRSEVTWTVTLSPKRAGRLIIPSLSIGDERSKALQLEVVEAAATTGVDKGTAVFIETEVHPEAPYVQGMLRYTVRLFVGTRLLEGSLSDPQPDNAIVRRLGEDKRFTAERDGQRYQVIERSYAVFPQASGDLTLTAPVLDARVADNSRSGRRSAQGIFGRDPFNSGLSSTRRIRVRGEARTIEVRPIPAVFSGAHWLPAESVELTEEWSNSDQIHVGDPLTRNIATRVRGVPGEQLPDLEVDQAAGFKVYPDRAQAETGDNGQDVEGRKTQSIAFVPVQAGQLVLPALRLVWWDTQADVERYAELPERIVEVLPARGSDQQTSPGQRIMPQNTLNDQVESARRSDAEQSSAWFLVSVVMLLLWCTTLFLWWYERRQRSADAAPASQNNKGFSERIGKSKKAFSAACKANDASAAKRHLLAWAGAHWPDDPPKGLDELARRFDDTRILESISQLNRVLYSETQAQWQGEALASSLKALPKQGVQQSGNAVLPELYG